MNAERLTTPPVNAEWTDRQLREGLRMAEAGVWPEGNERRAKLYRQVLDSRERRTLGAASGREGQDAGHEAERLSGLPQAARPSPSPPSPRVSHPTAKHRRGDPLSSRRAAEAASKTAPRAKDKLLRAFREAGERGLTYTEASEKSGVTPVSSSTRITELRDEGLIEPAGFTRESANGRQANVLRAVSEMGAVA